MGRLRGWRRRSGSIRVFLLCLAVCVAFAGIYSLHYETTLRRETKRLFPEPVRPVVPPPVARQPAPEREMPLDEALLNVALRSWPRLDVEKIAELVRQGANINARDADGLNFLMKYRSKNPTPLDLETLSRLLDLGLDPTMKDRSGDTLVSAVFQYLSFVAEHGSPEEFRSAVLRAPGLIALLVDRGADINAVNDYGRTVMSSVLRLLPRKEWPDPEAWLELLAGLSLDLNAVDENGSLPLVRWITGSQYSATTFPLVLKLIELGCDVDRPGPGGVTPLMVTAGLFPGRYSQVEEEVKQRLLELLTLLPARGATVDRRDDEGRTALLHAAPVGNNLDILRKLVALGADINARDTEGNSVFMKAAHARSAEWLETMAFFLSHPELRPESLRDAQTTALKLEAYAESGVYSTVPIPLAFYEQLLARKWTESETTDALMAYNPLRPLYLERVELLARHGADINARDADGKNPLMRYLSPGGYNEGSFREVSPDLVRSLIDSGLDVDARANDGRTLLTMGRFSAAQSPEFVKLLLDAGADVGARDDRGRTCLHVARPASNMKLLLEAGADPDAVDADGRTPLFYASDPEALKLLVSLSVDVDRRDRFGSTPLLAQMGRLGTPEGAEVLLNAGANVNLAAADGSTPLTHALQEPRFQALVRPLLEKGADPDAKYWDGRTLLCIFQQKPVRTAWIVKGFGRPYVESVDLFEELAGKTELLLEWGANPDEPDLTDKTPRDYARENPDPRMAELLDRLAAEYVPQSLNRTALMKAALEGDAIEPLEELLQSGESLDARDRHGWTALSFAAWANPDPKIARFLIAKGADANAQERLGRTPLMLAAWRNPNPEVFQALIEAGARLDLRDLAGDNAVDMAIARDREAEILRLYLEAGSRYIGRTRLASGMLLAACSVTSRPEVVRLLLDAGADPNARNDDGQTPLMKAANTDRPPEIAEMLIQAGADIEAKDDGGLSVLDYALKGNRRTLALLRAAGIRTDGKSAWWSDEDKYWLLQWQAWKEGAQ